MRILCPHCNAAYDVGPMIKNAILVCHRCHSEFSMDSESARQQQTAQPEHTDQSLPLFDQTSARRQDHTDQPDVGHEADSKESSTIPVPAFLQGEQQHTEHTTDEGLLLPQDEKKNAGEKALEGSSYETIKETDEEAPSPAIEEAIPPVRKKVLIWPWLIAILLMISAAGFWYKQDVWLDHPWVRSMLMNLHLPVEVRDKDWHIIPESVHGQWLRRDDNSQVLAIQGRIENHLYRELPPPQILIHFFDDTGITESLGEKLMPITVPPSMEEVKHAPFITPEVDRIPVKAQGQRGFFLVVESLPERTADFTLTPIATK